MMTEGHILIKVDQSEKSKNLSEGSLIVYELTVQLWFLFILGIFL